MANGGGPDRQDPYSFGSVLEERRQSRDEDPFSFGGFTGRGGRRQEPAPVLEPPERAAPEAEEEPGFLERTAGAFRSALGEVFGGDEEGLRGALTEEPPERIERPDLEAGAIAATSPELPRAFHEALERETGPMGLRTRHVERSPVTRTPGGAEFVEVQTEEGLLEQRMIRPPPGATDPELAERRRRAGDTSEDVSLAIGRGLSESGMATAIGFAELADDVADMSGNPSLGRDLRAAGERLRRVREENREFFGEPETTAGQVAGFTARLSGDLAQFIAPELALTRIGLLPKTVGMWRRIGREVAIGAPIDAMIAASDRENSLAGFAADLANSHEIPGVDPTELEEIANSPWKRAVFDATAGSIMAGTAVPVLEGTGRALGYAGRVFSQAAEAARRATPEQGLEVLGEATSRAARQAEAVANRVRRGPTPAQEAPGPLRAREGLEELESLEEVGRAIQEARRRQDPERLAALQERARELHLAEQEGAVEARLAELGRQIRDAQRRGDAARYQELQAEARRLHETGELTTTDTEPAPRRPESTPEVEQAPDEELQAAAQEGAARGDVEQVRRVEWELTQRGDRGREPPVDAAVGPRGERPSSDVFALPRGEIGMNPGRFQYKIEGRQAAGRALEGVEEWDYAKAGVMGVWWDEEAGRWFVVNGHNRMSLAEDVLGDEDLVNVIEYKVPTARDARAVGALVNMSEGRGTPVDAAKFIRDANLDPEELRRLNVPLTESKVEKGMSLARLHPVIFDDVVRKQVKVNRAAIIGRSGLAPEQQLALYRNAEVADLNQGELEELIRQVQAVGSREVDEGTQELLFDESLMESNFAERVKISSAVKRDLARDRRIFGPLSKAGRAERIEARGVGRVEAEEAGKVAGEAQAFEDVYQALSTRSGPVSDILNRHSRAVGAGEETLQEAKDAATEEIKRALRELIEEEGLGARGALRTEPGGEAVRPGAEGAPAARGERGEAGAPGEPTAGGTGGARGAARDVDGNPRDPSMVEGAGPDEPPTEGELYTIILERADPEDAASAATSMKNTRTVRLRGMLNSELRKEQALTPLARAMFMELAGRGDDVTSFLVAGRDEFGIPLFNQYQRGHPDEYQLLLDREGSISPTEGTIAQAREEITTRSGRPGEPIGPDLAAEIEGGTVLTDEPFADLDGSVVQLPGGQRYVALDPGGRVLTDEGVPGDQVFGNASDAADAVRAREDLLSGPEGTDDLSLFERGPRYLAESPEARARSVELESADAEVAFTGGERAKGKLAEDVAQQTLDFGRGTVDGRPVAGFDVEARLQAVRQATQKRAWVDARGHKLEDASDAVKLLYTFRDPQAERIHVFYLDDNRQVLAHTMESSGAINYVAVARDFTGRVYARARRVGASEVVLAHNHPSGNAIPSDEDLIFAQALRRQLRMASARQRARGVSQQLGSQEFRAATREEFTTRPAEVKLQRAYVIDGNEISEIQADLVGSADELRKKVRRHTYNIADAPGPDWTQLSSHPLTSVRGVADLLAPLERPDRFDVVYIDTQNQVLAIEGHSARLLEPEADHRFLEQRARALGAEGAFLVVHGNNADVGDFNRALRLAYNVQGDPDARTVIKDVIELFDDTPAGTSVEGLRDYHAFSARSEEGLAGTLGYAGAEIGRPRTSRMLFERHMPPGEEVRAAAVRDPSTGRVYAGRSHFDALEKVPEETDLAKLEDGYVTTNSRFVSREEALGIERAQGAELQEDFAGGLAAEELRRTPPKEARQRAQSAKRRFGTTDNPFEAGYITRDGTMLDFSGKRQGGSPNVRHMDHREIGQVFDRDFAEPVAAVHRFTSDGNLRLSVYDDLVRFDMATTITADQLTTLQRIARVVLDEPLHPRSTRKTIQINARNPATGELVTTVEEELRSVATVEEMVRRAIREAQEAGVDPANLRQGVTARPAREGPPAGLMDDEVLAPEIYPAAPRSIATEKANRTRDIAERLKEADPEAVEQAAEAMAPLVRPGARFIPIPDHTGSTEANRALAEAIARRVKGEIEDVLGRTANSESSLARRRAGEPGLTADEIEHTLLWQPKGSLEDAYLVDNVVTTGATATSARRALGEDVPVLAWAKEGRIDIKRARELEARRGTGEVRDRTREFGSGALGRRLEDALASQDMPGDLAAVYREAYRNGDISAREIEQSLRGLERLAELNETGGPRAILARGKEALAEQGPTPHVQGMREVFRMAEFRAMSGEPRASIAATVRRLREEIFPYDVGRPEARLGQEDLFGGTAPAEGGEQFRLFTDDTVGPQGLNAAEADAKQTVLELQPLVDANRASSDELQSYNEAMALLRRNDAIKTDELVARAREQAENRQLPTTLEDSQPDLFGPQAGRAMPRTVVSLFTAGAGAGVGGVMDDENPWRGAALGAVIGGGIPLLIGSWTDVMARRTKTLNEQIEESIKSARRGIHGAPIYRGPGAELTDDELREVLNFEKFPFDEAGEKRFEEAVRRVTRESGVKAPHKTVTLEQVRQIARELALDPSDLNATAAERLTGAELTALGNLVRGNIEENVRLHRALNSPRLTKDQEEELLRMIGQREDQIDHQLEKIMRGRSQKGRDLSHLRQYHEAVLQTDVFGQPIRTLADVPAEFFYIQAKKLLGEQPFTTEMAAEINRLLDAGDEQALFDYISSLRRSRPAEKTVAWYKAALMSAPITQIRNLAGNTTMAVLETMKDPVAWGFDRLVSLAMDVERTKGLSTPGRLAGASWEGVKRGTREADRAIRLSKSLQVGREEGVRAAVEEFRTQQTFRGMQRKYDLARTETSFNNLFLDVFTKSIFRTMLGGDRFYKGLALMRSLDETAHLTASLEGLKRGTPEFQRRVLELFKSPTDEMAAWAILDAEVSTFTNRNILGEIGQSLKRQVPLLEGVIPFTNTPGNIALRAFDYSPFGYLKTAKGVMELYGAVADGVADATARQELRTLQRQVADDFGRNTVGTFIFAALGYKLAEKGLMTGRWPSDRQTQREWQLRGINSNSIYIPEGTPGVPESVTGRWHTIENISPLGNIMGFGANLHSTIADPETTGALDIATGAAFGILSTVTEQSFLTGLSETLQAIDRPERATGDGFKRTLASFLIPNILKKVSEGFDTHVRTADTFGEELGRRLPPAVRFGPLEAPARRDVFGRPTEREGGLGKSLFDPFNARTDRALEDEVVAELSRVGTTIADLNQYEDETLEQYRERRQLVGRALYVALEELVTSPAYRQIPSIVERAFEQNPVLRDSDLTPESYARELQADMLSRLVENTKRNRNRAIRVQRAIGDRTRGAPVGTGDQ